MALLGRKQKQGSGGKERKKKNGGEDKSSVELSVEGSFIRPLGLKGAFWGYLGRVEGEIQQPIK